MRSAFIQSVAVLNLIIVFAECSLLLNSVQGQPRVDCGAESINVWVRTEHDFHGRLYVDEESENDNCVHSYSPIRSKHTTHRDNARLIEFNIRFGQCNMRRQRILNPRGVAYSFTLVVSFHPVFLTGVDKAFNIKCFFLEAVKAIDIALDVSPITTVTIEREYALPQCAYHLKHAPDGQFLKFANIGEHITHVWQCDPVAGWIYGVLIHSCYVDDGRGNRFDLIDEKGCAIDRYLLDDLVYDEKGLGAYVNTHVFRYADRIQLFFTCTLQLCFKDDGGCKGITPPSCAKNYQLPSSEKEKTKHGDNHRSLPSRPIPPGVAFRKFRPPLFSDRHVDSTISLPNIPVLGGPYKDSPINNTTENEFDLLELLINGTEMTNGTVRTSRDAAAGRMETDLSADLTVLPIHGSSSVKDTAENILNDENISKNKTVARAEPLNSLLSQDTQLNAQLVSQHSEKDCLRWNRTHMIVCIVLLIFVTLISASVVTALICVRLRKRQLRGGFGYCDRAVQRMWQ